MKVYILIKKKPNEIINIYSSKELAEENLINNPDNFYIIEKDLIYKENKIKSMIEINEKIYEPKHFNNIMPFGKYKGKLIGDIIQEDPNYLQWCCDNLSFELDEECLNLLELAINKEK